MTIMQQPKKTSRVLFPNNQNTFDARQQTLDRFEEKGM